MPNRFNYAYGVGVVDPDFYRYQYGTHDMTVYDLAVQKTRKFNFRLLGVRGARSKKLLDSWGIKSFMVGDPCLLLRPSSLLKKREDLVAISVGSSEPYEPVWGKTEDVAREVSKLCSILTKKGYTLVLVPFSDVDMPHIQRVAEETGLPIFEGYENIQSLLDFVSTCHILVGQRLHSAVFSAAALTPFLSIKYHSKCGEFSESVGFQEYTLQANLLSAEKLSHSFEELNNNWDDMQAKLEKNVEACRERLLMFASNITEDIESLPETKWSPPQSWKRMRFQLVNAIELSAPRLSRLWNRAFA
jgi:polysaccharide pyruvyl transferase WcaK-like protein